MGVSKPVNVLEVENLVVELNTRAGVMRVLDDISFTLAPGETLGIVGESGCGKSMTALSIMRLVPNPPGEIVGGAIRCGGENLLELSETRMRNIRGKDISMIFQEPMTSLNPVFTIGNQIDESLILHEGLNRHNARLRAVELLRLVDIPAPEKRISEYPHQMSGGMRQRVMIAMALACAPQIIIADEPTTALDVTVQAQVFELLKNAQSELGMAMILITHDMGVIAEIADKIAVMYAGRIVESGSVVEIFNNPQHPYAKGLISCVPRLEEDPPQQREILTEIPGVVPALWDLGKGCAFEPRCRDSKEKCRTEVPETYTGSGTSRVACWLAEADQ